MATGFVRDSDYRVGRDRTGFRYGFGVFQAPELPFDNVVHQTLFENPSYTSSVGGAMHN